MVGSDESECLRRRESGEMLSESAYFMLHPMAWEDSVGNATRG